MKTPAVALAARLALAVILVAVANTDGAALECSEGRIIGGQDATRGQFPWQVWIELYKTGFPNAFFCGGSIIDSQWVLTAGHCMEGVVAVKMTFGILLRNETTNETVVLRSTSIIQHEDFYTIADNLTKTYDTENDIALIKLPTRLNFSDVIQPAKLPRRSQREKRFQGENVTISGWGDTKYHQNPINVFPNSLKFVDLEVAVDAKVPTLNCSCTDGTYICTKDPIRSPFHGDSGGALVWKDEDGTTRQIGVVSSGKQDNETNPELPVYVNTFTSVPHYLDWIVKKTGIEIED